MPIPSSAFRLLPVQRRICRSSGYQPLLLARCGQQGSGGSRDGPKLTVRSNSQYCRTCAKAFVARSKSELSTDTSLPSVPGLREKLALLNGIPARCNLIRKSARNCGCRRLDNVFAGFCPSQPLSGGRHGTPQGGQTEDVLVNSEKHKGQMPTTSGDTSGCSAALRNSSALSSCPRSRWSSSAEDKIHWAKERFSSETSTSNSTAE